MWINLLIAAILLLATLAGYYFIRKRIIGDSVVTPRPARKVVQQGPNELEKIIATYRHDNRDAAPIAVSAKAAYVQPQPAQRPVPAPFELAAAATDAPTTSSAAHVQLRRPFLAGPNRLLYLVLKIGMPDHLVFANVRLADLVRVVNPAATPQARAQLAQTRIDFIVCTPNLEVIGLLDITDGNRADDVLKRQLEAQLTSGGCRYLRVTPNAIPKPAQIRALVCGS